MKKSHSIRAAAELLDVSVPFLRDEIKRGRLRARKLSRRILILDSDLDFYLENHSTLAAASQRLGSIKK